MLPPPFSGLPPDIPLGPNSLPGYANYHPSKDGMHIILEPVRSDGYNLLQSIGRSRNEKVQVSTKSLHSITFKKCPYPILHASESLVKKEEATVSEHRSCNIFRFLPV
jgi:hypothetical protein